MKYFFSFVLFPLLVSIHAHAQDKEFDFLEACWRGDSIKVVALLKDSVDVNTSTFEGVNGLMYTSQQGHLGVVRVLLENGARVNSEPVDGVTALIGAVRAGHLEVVEELILSAADFTRTDAKGLNPMFYAASGGMFYMVELLYHYGADVNSPSKGGLTPLMAAAYYGYYEVIGLLLELGADINAVDKAGNHALIYAAMAANPYTVEYLLQYMADVNHLSNKGFSALSVAVLNNDKETLALLLDYDANPNLPVKKRLRPLSLAIMENNKKLARTLRQNGASFNGLLAGATSVSVLSWIASSEKVIGFQAGKKELVLGLELYGGFVGRIGSNFVQQRVSESMLVQYREKRFYSYLGLNKEFRLLEYKGGSFCLSPGVRFWYSGASFAGAQNPKPVFRISPSVSAVVAYRNIFAGVGYDRFTSGLLLLPTQKYSLSVGYYFSAVNKTKVLKPSVSF